MKKFIFILVLLVFAQISIGQVNFVRTTPQASVFLTSVNDIDTVFCIFPKTLTSAVAFDTSKANRTALIPPQDYVSAQGKFTIYFTRSALGPGTVDSLRVWHKKLMPTTGIPVHNDSTFVVATGTTFANIINRSQYSFTVTDPTKGLAIMIMKGDTGDTNMVRLNLWMDFTQ